MSVEDSTVPLSREERIRILTKRIETEEAVLEIKDSLDTGLSVEELKTRLAHLRGRIGHIEEHLTVKGDATLAECDAKLTNSCKEVSILRHKQASIIQNALDVKNKYDTRIADLEIELKKLREKRKKELDPILEESEKIKTVLPSALIQMHTIADEMRSLCKGLKISDVRFLKKVYELDPTLQGAKVESTDLKELPSSWFTSDKKRRWIDWKVWLKNNGVLITRDTSGTSLFQEITGPEVRAILGKCQKTISNEIINAD